MSQILSVMRRLPHLAPHSTKATFFFGRRLLVAGLVVAQMLVSARAADDLVKEQVNWPTFLGRADMVWTKMPTKWTQSPFFGNGLVGAMIYSDKDNPMRWDIGSTNVWDHRDASPGHPLNPAFEHARLPLGHFTLRPVGTITATAMRVELWNAETTGQVTTDKGTIAWRAYAPATEKVISIAFSTTGDEKNFVWEWQPAVSISPRADPSQKRSAPAWYVGNPPVQMGKVGSDPASLQPMTAGGEYCTVWRETRPDENHRQELIAVGYSTTDLGDRAEAEASLDRATQAGDAKLTEEHRAWWHKFYPESFVSFSDTQLEEFYWIQMYKFASATRADRPALDLYGPWLPATPWPYICWDMNEPVEYSPVYTSNRLELGESLCRILDANVENLKKNVPPQFQADCAGIGLASALDCVAQVKTTGIIGDLPWALHNYWRQCAWAGDDDRLKNRLYPLLKLSINYYLKLLRPGPDGKLHLPPTFSPEYKTAPDCNYDLSLLRWGLLTLIHTAKEFNIQEPLLPQWQQTLANLTPYPEDPNDGFLIGAGVPLEKAHRHYSHLLMIFPLHLVNWEQPENRDVIEKSLHHWMTVPGAGKLGFTYMGAASIDATMGRGDEALEYLHQNLQHVIYPNTMYAESCIETPLGMDESIQDMFLHTLNPEPETDHAPIIRVFPAMPAAWKNASFHNLRAQGAFLLSGMRQDGENRWISITSLAGKPCLIRPGLADGFKTMNQPGVTIVPKKVGDGLYELPLKRGQQVVLYTAEPLFAVSPATGGDTKQENFYGLHEDR